MIGKKIVEIRHDNHHFLVVCQLEINCVKKKAMIPILSLDANSSLVVFRSLAKRMRQWRIVQRERQVGFA